MVAFNRQETKVYKIECATRRAITQAKQGHPDMKLKHPDWCRDANKGDYTILKKSIKESCEKKQLQNERFRSKLHATKQ